MKATAEGLRGWAAIDADADDVVVQLVLEGAKGWFRRAGVPEVPEGDEDAFLYVLGVYMLATHYYENRAALPDGKIASAADATMPIGVMGIRNQLQVLFPKGGDANAAG